MSFCAFSCTLFRPGFLGDTDPDPYPRDGIFDEAIEVQVDGEVSDKVGPYNTDPDDWKRFRVVQRTRLSISLERARVQQPLVVRVYTEGSKLKGSMLCFEESTHSIVDTYEPGTYLIEIVAKGETIIPYRLRVEPVDAMEPFDSPKSTESP